MSANDNTRRVSMKKGVVVSDKMDKTIVVKIKSVVRHPFYKKVVTRSIKVKAHDEKNVAKVGDVVKIGPIRPLSKDKRWKLCEVVKKT